MRALEFGDVNELRERWGSECDVAPLPESSYTRPNLVVTPHRFARRSHESASVLANEKEI